MSTHDDPFAHLPPDLEPLDPTLDVVFERLFTHPKNEALLRDFLEAALQRPGPIASLELLGERNAFADGGRHVREGLARGTRPRRFWILASARMTVDGVRQEHRRTRRDEIGEGRAAQRTTYA